MSRIKSIRESAKNVKDSVKGDLKKAGVSVKGNLKKAEASIKSAKESIKRSIKNVHWGTKEEAANKMLDKLSDRLEKAKRYMCNIIRRGKRGVKYVSKGDDIKKYAKDILNEYYDDYKDLTLDNLKKLEKICKKYGVILSDRLDWEIYRGVFEAIRLTSKERNLTPERLRMFSRKIFNDLKQTCGTGDRITSVVDPFFAFMQLFQKVGIFFRNLIEEIKKYEYSNLKIRRNIEEMESTVFKKFPVINLYNLYDEQYRVNCKEQLIQFGEEISSLSNALNEGQGKLGKSDSAKRFGELLDCCANL